MHNFNNLKYYWTIYQKIEYELNFSELSQLIEITNLILLTKYMSIEHHHFNNQIRLNEESEKMQINSSLTAQKKYTPNENSKWLLKTIKTLCKYCNNPLKYEEIKKELEKRGLIQPCKDYDNGQSFIEKEPLQNDKNESPFPQVYKILDVVSNKGELCSVMKIKNLIDQQIYALKSIKLICSDIPNAMHEVQCLAHLKSPRLVRYFSSWIKTDPNSQFLTFYIQTEFYEGLNLQKFLQNRSIDQDSYQKIFHKILHELAKALCEIRQAGIVHRDLQPSNIILKSDFSIVVIGFSISSPIHHVKNHRYMTLPPSVLNINQISIENKSMSLNVSPLDILRVNAAETATNFPMRKLGSPIYASPQQLNGRKSCPGDDIYSFGIIMFEILVNIEGERKKVEAIRQLRNSAILPEKFVENYPEESELILKMTSHDPSKRPTAQDVIQSDLFKKWENEINSE